MELELPGLRQSEGLVPLGPIPAAVALEGPEGIPIRNLTP